MLILTIFPFLIWLYMERDTFHPLKQTSPLLHTAWQISVVDFAGVLYREDACGLERKVSHEPLKKEFVLYCDLKISSIIQMSEYCNEAVCWLHFLAISA